MTASLARVGRFLAVEGDGGILGELGRLGRDGSLLGVSLVFGSPELSRFSVPDGWLFRNESRPGGMPANGDPGGLSLAVFLAGVWPKSRRLGVVTSSGSGDCLIDKGSEENRTFCDEPVFCPTECRSGVASFPEVRDRDRVLLRPGV